MARQPEVAGNIQTAMIIAAALVEGVTFFALIVCLLSKYRVHAPADRCTVAWSHGATRRLPGRFVVPAMRDDHGDATDCRGGFAGGVLLRPWPRPLRRPPRAARGGRRAPRLNPINFHGMNFRGDLTIWTAVVFLVVLAIL